MKPKIDSTTFGSITIGGEKYEHDVIIRLSGKVKKRKKKLSKSVFGSSHTISLDEAEHVYREGADLLIFGTGQYGAAGLSDAAKRFFEEKECKVLSMATPEAVAAWNGAEGNVIGLFHVTC